MNICPYCLSPLSDADNTVKCPICATQHHAECWQENDGCAVKNCEKSTRPRPIEIEVDAEPHTMLVLSKESVEQVRPKVLRRISNPCMKCGKQLPEGQLYCMECTPALEDNQDTRNVGPLLVMLLVLMLVVGWILVATGGLRPIISPDSDGTGQQSSHIRH